MPYTHTTFLQLRQALASRLSDTGNSFWVDAELSGWIKESLRTWGAHSSYWRDRGTFNTSVSTPFYDITSILKNGGGEFILGYSVTDRDLITAIQYHLMEPATGSTWMGSEQFTFADVFNAVSRRRDQFLTETGCVLTRTVINTPPNAIGRVPLTDNIIDVRRCAWVDTSSAVGTVPLFPSDELQAAYAIPSWESNPATPSVFSTIIDPPLTVQLIPAPVNKGSLDLLTVNAGPTLDPATTATALGVPDDLAWVVKWGALADLLGRDGQARDPDRATYCESRWRQGVELARINATTLTADIQGVDNIMDDLWSVDVAMPTWQTSTGVPSVVATAGRNIIAVAQTPDAGPYSITLDVVRNAVVPTTDGDYIQVGREVVDVILDYAEHLAAFKMQGEEWKATNRGMDNLMRMASQYNDKLRASALFKEIIWPTAYRYKEKAPRRVTEPQPEMAAANG